MIKNLYINYIIGLIILVLIGFIFYKLNNNSNKCDQNKPLNKDCISDTLLSFKQIPSSIYEDIIKVKPNAKNSDWYNIPSKASKFSESLLNPEIKNYTYNITFPNKL